MGEEYRIRLTRALMDLREDETKTSIEFPSTLTNTERKFVHELTTQLGLKSRSVGKDEKRRITVTKPNRSAKKTVVDEDAIPVLSVGPKGLEALQLHMKQYPPSYGEELESRETGASLMEALTQGQDDDGIAALLNQIGMGVQQEAPEIRRRDRYVDFNQRIAQHGKWQREKQTSSAYAKMLQGRAKLPAYQHFDEIVQTVANNAITIVSGETGCGMCQ